MKNKHWEKYFFFGKTSFAEMYSLVPLLLVQQKSEGKRYKKKEKIENCRLTFYRYLVKSN